MKIRLDFVTNSSSSSFLCECCGNIEGGYDVCLTEVGMRECEEGHVFCEEHVGVVPFEYKKSALIRELKNSIEYYSHKNEDYAIKRLVKLTCDIDFVNSLTEQQIDEDDDLADKFDDLISNYTDETIPKESCPLCSHKYVSNEQMLDFALEKLNINKKEFEKTVREYLIEKDKNK